MGLLLRLERAFLKWWHHSDLPSKGDADYDVLERHWQGDGSELTVISERPEFSHFLLCFALFCYMLLAQTDYVARTHWYVLACISAVLTYCFLTASTEYRLLEWETYLATRIATLADRQRLGALQESDPQGYFILLRRLLGSRFPVHFSYERQASRLIPIVRLWTPSDSVEKLWAVASPLHVFLAYSQHNAVVLLCLSVLFLLILRKARENLAVKTVISDFAQYQHSETDWRGYKSRNR